MRRRVSSLFPKLSAGPFAWSALALLLACIQIQCSGKSIQPRDPFFESRRDCKDAVELAEFSISEADEIGPLSYAPLDTDGDGIFDAEDLDNDGDGLLDLYDEQPFDRLSQGLTSADLIVLTGTFLARDKRFAMSTAQPGEKSVVMGTGIRSCDMVIAIDDGAGTVLNIRPDAVGKDSIEFIWPEIAGASLTLIDVASQRASNTMQVTALAAGAPVLFTEQYHGESGSTVTMHGINLAAVDTVAFGETEVAPSSTSDASLEVSVPESNTEKVRVQAATLASNQTRFLVTQSVRASVRLPAGLGSLKSANIASLLLQIEPLLADSDTVIQTRASRLDTVFLLSSDDELLLQAAVLPGQSSVRIDALSSAVSVALQASGAARKKDLAIVATLLEGVPELPEVISLAATIEGASSPQELWTAPTAQMSEQIASAAVATQLLMNTLLPGPAVRPSMVTTENDIRIDPERKQDQFTLEPAPKIADLQLKNESQMIVSLSIKTRDDDRTVIPHAIGPLSSNVIGADDINSSYRHPGGRAANAELITPGLLAPQPTGAAKIRAQDMMALRTVVERFVFPIVEPFIPFDDSEVLLSLLIASTPDLLNGFASNIRNGSLKASVNALLETIKSDFASGGSISQAALKQFGEVAAKRAAKKFAAYLVPTFLVMEAIAKTIDFVMTVTESLQAIQDIQLSKGVYNWEVAYDFGITSINFTSGPTDIPPNAIVQDYESVSMVIEGVGFFPKKIDNVLVFPTLTITDLGGGAAAQTIRLALPHPNNDVIIRAGRSIEGSRIDINAQFASRAVGPLEIKLTKGIEEAIGPAIDVIRAIEIESISPTVQRPGENVLVTGVGFDTAMAAGSLKFFFRAADESISAIVAGSVTATQAEIIVPDLPDAPANEWTLYAEGGISTEFPVRSNGVPFLLAAFEITSLSPASGLAGQTMSISGLGFTSDTADMRVFFKDATSALNILEATITGSTPDAGSIVSIEATVPTGVIDQTSWLVYVQQTPQGQIEKSNELPFAGAVEVLAATGRDGSIYVLDQNTASDSLAIHTEVGNDDPGVISSLLWNPAVNQLWAGAGGQALCDGCLYRVDTETSQLIELDAGDPNDALSAMTMLDASGPIFAPRSDGEGMRILSNTTGAVATSASGTGGTSGNGITFAADGTLYMSSSSNLYVVDPTDGSEISSMSLSFVGFPTVPGGIISGMTTRADGVIFAIVDGTKIVNSYPCYLATLDPVTGVVTYVGTTERQFEGLAFVPASIVPTGG